ncbi:uncharacterized protein [Triticum aestivum]|uniref:uncharacterized protein isoform X4 n=1 Tax=Triticum aestivum TaxID=4565 RepID=UPI001D00D305|nr:uncharacterized protein LOC123060672 isoform X4 [Triticum aestivum]
MNPPSPLLETPSSLEQEQLLLATSSSFFPWMCCCSGPSLCFSSLVRVQLLRSHGVFRVALPSRPQPLLCLVCRGSQWGREGLRLEVPARQLTDALNGSDFLKEKEVPKGDGSNKSLNLRVKEVEPEEVQGRIIVACGWLVQGNFRAGAAARVPEQAPRHWRSVGRILETKVRLYLVSLADP